MSVEHVYGQLEILAAQIEDLEQAMAEREEFFASSFAQAQDAFSHEIEALGGVLERVRQELAQKNQKDKGKDKLPDTPVSAKPKKSTPQGEDLFSGWAVSVERAANDRRQRENALILAGKLDSTIDKVHRLLREASGGR